MALKNTFTGGQRKSINGSVLSYTVKDKKKLACMTIKILKDPLQARIKKLMKKNRRESDSHEQLWKKPIDKERVMRNINRIRISLLR
jgi:hypothetical protein